MQGRVDGDDQAPALNDEFELDVFLRGRRRAVPQPLDSEVHVPQFCARRVAYSKRFARWAAQSTLRRPYADSHTMSTATIRITHPDGRIEERVLTAGAHEIGREAGQIVIADPNLSALHARLDVQLGQVTLIDLGSSNGTYTASGQRLFAPYLLEPGQAVRLGGTTLTLLGPAAPVAGGTQVLAPLGAGPAYPMPAYGASPEAIELRRLADRWMILAIGSIFCGCGLPGIINVVLASQAKGAIDQGDYVSARSKLGTVKLLCILGWSLLAATLLFMILVYGGLFLAMFGSAATQPRSF